VPLTDERRTADTTLLMWRYAAITGTVLDEHNEPLIGAQVRVLREDFVSGQRRLTPGAADTTDDRGYFRISTLEPGTYIVALPMIHRQSFDNMMGMPAGGAGERVAMVAVRATAASLAATLGRFDDVEVSVLGPQLVHLGRRGRRTASRTGS
jgi:hypothetical protein